MCQIGVKPSGTLPLRRPASLCLTRVLRPRVFPNFCCFFHFGKINSRIKWPQSKRRSATNCEAANEKAHFDLMGEQPAEETGGQEGRITANEREVVVR